ncbi:hypothetical protein [Arthrobacter sp. CAN_C5]|uniref:hypothetical protein n=1 Tax=Arthrobacter sp. CAN_C5 TaxID=2760706 RepID=UPI001AE67D07|nr:hypothetical protein [Arthrobacter sp. CAN_C5]MBP2216913.1 hypothetical protein [Arthrobacter sp. CAN_C5]
MTINPVLGVDHRGAGMQRPVRRKTAAATALGFLIVVAFQMSLMFGAPFGAAALGGANAGQLPVELRVVSGVSAAIWTFATMIVLARGGFVVSRLPRGLSRWGTWVLVGYLAIGVLMNLASSSPWERFGWAPFTLALFILTLVLALGGFARVPAMTSADSR